MPLRAERVFLLSLLIIASPWCHAVTLPQIIAGAPSTDMPGTAAAAPGEGADQTQDPVLSQIRFVGNKVTRERTLLRELPFAMGDRVSTAQLEAGRQAIQNLNLFKKVTLETVRSGQDRFEAIYTVDERWYVLGYPRVDGNSNGEYAYGGQLDWNNVWGLNHTLRLSVLRKETKRVGIGKEQNYTVGYSAPQIFDSLWSVGLGASYTERPVNDDLGEYNERLEAYQAIAYRALDSAQPNQGWSMGAGLLRTEQRTNNGIGEYGEAMGPVGVLNYRDLKLNIYSEEGFVFNSRFDTAAKGLAADYDFARLTLAATRYWHVGSAAHQTVHLLGDIGMNWAGPNSVRNFTLGGVGGLRGYEHGYREGNAYYRVGAEWARPVFKPWLRTVVIAEAGNVYAEPNDFELQDVRASIGLGLRLRVPMFVNVQLEAGIAFPVGGGAPRFFAGQL